MGRHDSSDTATITAKPRETSSRRVSRPKSRKRTSDAGNSTIVYLARMPRQITAPVADQYARLSLVTARCARTSAQPQQQVYGESIVMSNDPAATGGIVSAPATSARPNLGAPST